MIDKVIEAVVKNVSSGDSLDTIKMAIKVASDAIGLDYTKTDWHYMFIEIMYRLEA